MTLHSNGLQVTGSDVVTSLFPYTTYRGSILTWGHYVSVSVVEPSSDIQLMSLAVRGSGPGWFSLWAPFRVICRR